MQVELIKSWAEFDKLSEEWNTLLASSAANNLFLTWEWFQAWRESTQEAHAPLVITIRDQGKLIAAAPFYLSKLVLGGILPYRTLRMLADQDTGAEYPNIIIANGFESQVYPLIVQSLEQNAFKWDCLWLPNWKGWDTTFTAFIEQLSKSKRLGFYHRERPFAAFPLPATMDEFYAQMSKNQKTAVKRIIKKIAELEDTSVNICQTAEELPTYLENLFDLHYRRWAKAGEDGAFRRKPAMQAFYEAFTPKALAAGWLRIADFKHQGETKAIQIGYIYDGAFHQMQEGFDPEFIEGVGNYLRINFIETCIKEGVGEYDFLGGYSEHKRRWGGKERSGHDLFVWRKTLKTLPFSLKPIWPSGRYMKFAP